jgi:LDH2 family malate/lactate/ureidoglycolate dehydrogenase
MNVSSVSSVAARERVAVSVSELERAVAGILRANGVSDADSRRAAEVLCYADRSGRSSHGVSNLDRIYLSRLRSGVVDAFAQPVRERTSPATSLLDGRQSLGLSTGVIAMDLAMDHARSAGVGLVIVRNSSHFGCTGYFTERAARQGMIAIAATNCGSQRVAPPPAGRVRMLGTNPISVAAPAGALAPFVLDMSTTVVATSRIRQAARRGEQIPRGWLVGDDGAAPTDPEEFLAGRADVTFLGGDEANGSFKGYGLAIAVDVLCGLLAGAAVGPGPLESDGSSDRDIGHMFLAIRIGAFRDEAAYAESATSMFDALLHCPPRNGSQVLYPGLPEHARLTAADADGVRLDAAVYEEIVELAVRSDVAPPAMKSGRSS